MHDKSSICNHDNGQHISFTKYLFNPNHDLSNDVCELKPNQILNIESYGQKIILENACVVGEWPNNVFCLHFEGLFYSINNCCIYFGVDSPRGPSLRRAGNTNLISVYLWVSCAFTAKVVIDLWHKAERTVFSQKRLFSDNGS